MENKTVADVLVNTLELAGVKRVFGIVGDSLNAITDSLRRKKSIEWVHTRHEEVAAFAAGAAAHLTGELAVCAGSCGPGNLHLINGLFDCQRNHVPVLAIAAHIPTVEIGGDYFQATHPEILFKECSYFCEHVSSPDQIPRMLAMAMQTAITKRGVAVLVIPGDIALSKATTKEPAQLPPEPKPSILPNPEELKKIATLLNQSEKVTLLCGSGCKDAHDELMALCDTLQSPVVHALRGKEFVEYDNPYDVGMTGFIGTASGYYAMESCETLLLLGTSFPYRQFYPSDARVIQIDVAGEKIRQRCRVDIGVIGNIKDTIPALLPLLTKKKNRAHLDKALEHYKKSRKILDDLATGTPGKLPIHPQYVAKMISEAATDNAIFSCDVGTATIWAARYLKMNGKRRLLGSFNHGSMANALAQAIGAQATFPNRQVVAMCGDGGFTMLMGDLITLTQENLPVKVVIFNNGTLGFVELEMKAAGFLDTGTELRNPNFAAMANAMGIFSIRVEDPADVQSALQKAFAHKGPAVIDMVTNRMELSMPPKITAEQVKGFGLYVARAILNDRADEVIELAKSNLWR